MPFLTQSVLNKIYNRGSLRNAGGKVRFSVKNRLSPATLLQIRSVSLDGQTVPGNCIALACDARGPIPADQISEVSPLEFPLGTLLTFQLDTDSLQPGAHEIELDLKVSPFGQLILKVSDSLKISQKTPGNIPRDPENDYSQAIIKSRQEFIREQTGAALTHTSQYSYDPELTRGNIEHFTGAVQVPLGFAGPLLMNGEHARGEFYVPLATSEGTLVASYNRGMKVLHLSGGVKSTVVGDNMQRAPVFIFEDAQQGRIFAHWIGAQTEEIRAVCNASDPFVKLDYIDHYLASKFVFLRFNFTTGDAAGMNMVGKATFAACNWILQNCDTVEIQRFFLESNLATDKKASMINIMRTRGKRVTAEAVIKRDVLRDIMDADTESIYCHGKVANIGSMLSGANNNGCHSANAITAIFIATGHP